MERIAAKRIATIVVAAGLLIACGGGSEPEGTATTEVVTAQVTTAIAAVSTTAPAASTTALAPGEVLVESTHYPYALTIPAEELLAPFKPATIALDGESRVTRDRPFLDALPLSEGFVFILGIEWPDDLESLAQMVVDRYVQDHGCSPATNQRGATVGEAPALVFTVDGCGPENATFVRLAALNDGFGLIAFKETSPGQEAADIDQIVARLASLEWRAG